MSELSKDIEFIIEHSKDVWQHLNMKMPLSRMHSFVFGLTERFFFTALGLRPLLSELTQTPQVEFSIGIILRSTILDILVALNFHKALLKNSTSTADAEKFANEMLADGLKFTLNYFDQAKNCGLISAQELKDNYNDIAKRFKPFFEQHNSDGTKPVIKYSKYYSPEALFSNVYQEKEMREISKFIDLYQFYSKYDHFGILYFDLVRQPMAQKIENINSVVIGMVIHLFTLISALNYLDNSDTFYIEKLKVMAKYIEERRKK